MEIGNETLEKLQTKITADREGQHGQVARVIGGRPSSIAPGNSRGRSKDTEGKPVFKVEDGQQVVSLARQVKPDVILLDISLSGLSGLEITRLIKKELSQIPVVILLDEENEKYEKAVERSGAWGYVVKSRVAEVLPVLLEKLQHREKGGNL